MKKIFTLLTSISLTLGVFAQSPRTVMVEHFTQASCGPCAVYNPAMNTILENNKDIVAVVKYQTAWPGYDPMNLHNPSMVNTRVRYYGVSAVPGSVLDGNGPTHPNQINDSNIYDRALIESAFEMSVTHKLSSNLKTIKADVTITATQTIDEPLVAHIVVVEKEITFQTAPGSNGEKVFHSVAKQMLPSTSGTTLPNTWAVGDTRTITVTWDLANVYDLQQLAVVAFVQNPVSKAIHQAAKTEPNLVANGPVDPLLSDGTGTGDFGVQKICQNSTYPVVVLMNGGSDNLTSAKIHYRINGGAEQVHDWSGNLKFLEKTEIILPLYNFQIATENTFEAWVSDPNGGSNDAATDNNQITAIFGRSPLTTLTSKVEAIAAITANALTWELTDDAAQVIESSGTLPAPRQIVSKEVNLNDGRCYYLKVKNTTSGANGNVRLKNAQGVEIFKQDAIGNKEWILEFGASQSSGLTDLTESVQFNLQPNPASEMTTVSIHLENAGSVDFQVVNAVGQVVSQKSGNYAQGLISENLDIQHLPKGLYFVRILLENGQAVKRFVKE